MRGGIFVLLGMAAAVLGGPAVAMNTLSTVSTPQPVAGTPATPAPSCDGCDPSATATAQTDTAGSSTGPITDSASGRRARTAVPSHVPDPPKTPKG